MAGFIFYKKSVVYTYTTTMKKKLASKKKTVFVGLSGGVDSAVSAALLCRSGFDVVGVFIKTWQPDFIECTWKEERKDAMRIAAHLNIPFITLDLEHAYKEGVAEYMIAEYEMGRTPNPDVMCNKEVKFGAFLSKALVMGADAVATGHYAQNILNNGRFELHASPDSTKDQSYFLWTLKEEQLMHVIFPVGGMNKKEVRKYAEFFKIPVATKKDSQGVCFLGPLDMKEFLGHYIKNKKGKVLSTEGKIIGEHDGAWFYTLGERHGFTITQKSAHDMPYYVVAKDIKKNTLTVSTTPKAPGEKSNTLTLEQFHIVTPGSAKDGGSYDAVVRYHGERFAVELLRLHDGGAQLRFKSEKPLVSSGQSVVLYQKERVIGGGVVAG
ncbi:MAG: tRNA-specific 2-thiouridylase MnmA [Patescibacteria group bacterium]|nr:tRNA-specific 2-thiouridylase MnmA [Patescibacteria group bacterium]